jgi:hypothetical protein
MPDQLLSIASNYTNFTMTGDGIPEINSLSYLPFESEYPEPATSSRLALVLVEPRLLDAVGDATLRPALLRSLRRLKGDLRAEGLLSRFFVADIYNGTAVQKDGRVLLALRRFLRDVRTTFARLEGVILVGRFPDSTLVRRVSWCPGFLSPRQLAIWPELISERADIVLSDLNGNWEALYQQNDFQSEGITATPDAATTATGWFDGESVRNCEFASNSFTRGPGAAFRDAFFIDDAMFEVLEHTVTPPHLRLRLHQAEHNSEVHLEDHTLVNIIARPEIAVSRINAHHVAVNPNPALTGTGGHHMLDPAGNPQTVASASPLFDTGSQWTGLFTQRDFDLERRLLVSYLDRNHRFRNGSFSNLPFRGAVISGTTDFNPDSYEPLINAAAADLGPCVKVANADLRQYVAFHKTPAVLKYIMAHSDAHHSAFRDGYDVPGFTADVGGAPFRWAYQVGQHVPSFEGMGGGADIFTHRALWHHHTLDRSGASLVIHGGCNVNSVPEAQSMGYCGSTYAHWNNAEGLLFYTNAVALFSRAKGFNDAPGGFADGYRLSDRANFGSCLKSYFNAQANDAGLTTYNIQRKRAYFWSVNGDWSMRLRNRNGLGVLALDGGLSSVEVHPNRAWIDGWNYDAAVNAVRAIGDVDGDGRDEFVITSDWGIGILKYDGHHFRALLVAARDTWFGGWRYDASVNTGRDRIMGARDFAGSGKSEIMIWSSWGITTLEYTGGSLSPSRIHPNGTRLGGWLLNTSDNRYCGCGQFDADYKNDMVVTSPWGIGIISLQRGDSVFMAPNGTRLGHWLLNTGDNTVRLIGDFDGDTFDEILVSSPWGIGVLKLTGGSLTIAAMYPNGAHVDGYVVNSSHAFALADNLRGGTRKQIVIASPDGIHVLQLDAPNGRLRRVAFVATGTRVDGWVIDTSNNRLLPAGDMNGDGRAEILIRSPWGIGVLGVDTNDQIRCHTLMPYGSVLKDWFLQSGDVVAGNGRLAGAGSRNELLVVKP